ncbi:unnamed protein product, partial [Discosporangium mesarthrocarpum]
MASKRVLDYVRKQRELKDEQKQTSGVDKLPHRPTPKDPGRRPGGGAAGTAVGGGGAAAAVAVATAAGGAIPTNNGKKWRLNHILDNLNRGEGGATMPSALHTREATGGGSQVPGTGSSGSPQQGSAPVSVAPPQRPPQPCPATPGIRQSPPLGAGGACTEAATGSGKVTSRSACGVQPLPRP